MTVTIPLSLHRNLFGNESRRSLLLALAREGAPVGYSEVRRRLALHPQQFQRSLDWLEDHGLVGLSAPADLEKSHAERSYRVYLEPTALGLFCAELGDKMNADFSRLADERNLPREVLTAALGSG